MDMGAGNSSRAFTLIELLVAIAIIALLVALLLPTLGSVDRLGKNTHCQKNLLEMGKALNAYCAMNDGWYPYPVDDWSGLKFCGPRVSGQSWAGLAHVMQLKQIGAGPQIFFCPFDPLYGEWDAWPANTWETPYVASWDPDQVRVYIGYTLLTYRGWASATGGLSERFTDDRLPPGNNRCADDIPIAADLLHCRANMLIMTGWYHGGGLPDGLFNAGGNTLFKGGFVVHADAGEWDWNEPGIVMGSRSRDQFWFALRR